MFGVSSRVVLECALTEPGLEMIARLLNHLDRRKKTKKSEFFVLYQYFLKKKAFCPMVNTLTLTCFREKAGSVVGVKFSLQILLCNSEHDLKSS